MDRRVQAEADDTEAASLGTAVYVLMGLQYSSEHASALLKGVRTMKNSVTYQSILEEGKAEGKTEAARDLFMALASRRFGWPDEESRAKVEGISDYALLKSLTERVLETSGWADLLAGI